MTYDHWKATNLEDKWLGPRRLRMRAKKSLRISEEKPCPRSFTSYRLREIDPSKSRCYFSSTFLRTVEFRPRLLQDRARIVLAKPGSVRPLAGFRQRPRMTQRRCPVQESALPYLSPFSSALASHLDPGGKGSVLRYHTRENHESIGAGRKSPDGRVKAVDVAGSGLRASCSKSSGGIDSVLQRRLIVFSDVIRERNRSPTKIVWATRCVWIIVLMDNMSSTTVGRKAKEVQPVRNWIAFAVPNGQVVYRGRYYFAWSRGRFIGAYDSLDDAVESLAFRRHH